MQLKDKRCLDKQRLYDYLICVCAVLLIVLLFATGLLNKQKVWTDVQLDHVRENASYSLEEGDDYGVKATGPYYDLPKGTYRVQWQINGDGANVIRFENTTGGEIVPSQVYTEPGKWQGAVDIEIKEPVHNFYISVDFTEGSWMEIYNFRLYSPEYTDGAWLAALILLLIVGLWLKSRHGMIDKEHLEAICVLGLAVLIIAVPILHEDTVGGADVDFHTARLMNLADGLRSGQFPVRAGGFSYNGYGAITSVFYPDLLLYPYAIMINCGASLACVMNIARVIITAMAAMMMYTAAKRIFNNHVHALCSAVVYVCAPHFLGVMWGFTLGQMQAMAFFPLVIWGIWEVIYGDKNRWTILVFAATLVFQSHMLSVLLCALVACAVGIICLPRIIKDKRLGTIVKAIVVTLLMNLFMVIPMITSYLNGTNSLPIQFGFVNSAVPIRELLIADKMTGFPVLLGCVCAVTYAERKDGAWKIAKRMGIAGSICALLCTSIIPWSYIVILTNELITLLQFPYRFMSLALPLLCLCAGYGYEAIFRGKSVHTAIIVLAISVAVVWPAVDAVINGNIYIEFGMGSNPYVNTPEYQIEGTDVNDTRDRTAHLFGDVQLTSYKKDGTQIVAEIASEKGGSIEFPLFAFDGYAAELDGQRLDIARGDNNRMLVDIPAGTNGTLRIWFEGKMLWRAADALSLLSAVIFLVYLIKRCKNESFT